MSERSPSAEPVRIRVQDHPILVDVQFGRSAVVGSVADAIRYGFAEDGYYSEFYTLDLIESPTWVKITRDNEDPEVGVFHVADDLLAAGDITPDQHQWVKDQFD